MGALLHDGRMNKMKIKVYSPNGKELSIRAEKLNECPLCHELALIENINNENEEGVDLFCFNCNLEFTSFSLRNFIKLRGFGGVLIK